MDQPTTDLLPRPDLPATRRLAAVGLIAVGVAAVVGLAGDGPGPLASGRLALTGVGCLLGGIAVARRPDRPEAWGLFAAACWLAGLAALPGHWDSARTLGRIAGGIGLAFAVVQTLPMGLRPVAATLGVLFHFGGILGAVTWPNPTPWITQQVMSRVYTPYLRAVYLTNAYHFYSPEPGPASLLYVLLTYDVDGRPVSEWEVMPTRARHMKDPLGLSYYRRLSLTEAVSQTLPDGQTADTFNRVKAQEDRGRVAITGFTRPGPDGKPETVVIPLPPPEFEPLAAQYRVPDPLVLRNLLPSYARHLAGSRSAPGRAVTNVRLYRLEHRVVPPESFIGAGRYPRIDPFHPTTYRAYFLGDYDPAGKLVNPQDPLLYWLIPITPKPGGAAPGDKDKIDFDDYLSRHAGFQVEWGRP
jgi:hypothetical protein